MDLDESLMEGDGNCVNTEKRVIVVGVDAKRALVGAGARILFYPTLLYNVFRNKIQSEFRWWDQIDQVCFVPLGKNYSYFCWLTFYKLWQFQHFLLCCTRV